MANDYRQTKERFPLVAPPNVGVLMVYKGKPPRGFPLPQEVDTLRLRPRRGYLSVLLPEALSINIMLEVARRYPIRVSHTAPASQPVHVAVLNLGTVSRNCFYNSYVTEVAT